MSISSIAIPNMAQHHVVGIPICDPHANDPAGLAIDKSSILPTFATTIGRAAIRLAENSNPSTSRQGRPISQL